MPIILAVPVLGIALMLQTGIVSRINLLSGNADLIMAILVAWSLQERVKTSWYWAIIAGLLVGFVSGLPWFIPLTGYLLVVGVGRIMQRRVWQAPLLATFVVIFIGTVIMSLITIGYLILVGGSFSLVEAFSIIVLPSTLLNILVAMPVFYLMKDLANLIYPSKVNV
jgi:rod shape-determining protein MreD